MMRKTAKPRRMSVNAWLAITKTWELGLASAGLNSLWEARYVPCYVLTKAEVHRRTVTRTIHHMW